MFRKKVNRRLLRSDYNKSFETRVRTYQNKSNEASEKEATVWFFENHGFTVNPEHAIFLMGIKNRDPAALEKLKQGLNKLKIHTLLLPSQVNEALNHAAATARETETLQAQKASSNANLLTMTMQANAYLKFHDEFTKFRANEDLFLSTLPTLKENARKQTAAYFCALIKLERTLRNLRAEDTHVDKIRKWLFAFSHSAAVIDPRGLFSGIVLAVANNYDLDDLIRIYNTLTSSVGIVSSSLSIFPSIIARVITAIRADKNPVSPDIAAQSVVNQFIGAGFRPGNDVVPDPY